MSKKALESWINQTLLIGKSDQVFDVLKTLPFHEISALEQACSPLLQINWEKLFSLKFPITFARYQSNTYKTNATLFLNCKVVIDYKLLWEKFNQILSSNHHNISNPFVHMCFGTNIGDEFGIGPIYYKNGNELFSFKNNKSIQFAKWIGSNQTSSANNNNQIHGIPLQSKVILEIFAPNGRELVLIDPNDTQHMKDSSCWAINYPHGNWLDLPPFLTGAS